MSRDTRYSKNIGIVEQSSVILKKPTLTISLNKFIMLQRDEILPKHIVVWKKVQSILNVNVPKEILLNIT